MIFLQRTRLTHFSQILPFNTTLKHQKIRGFRGYTKGLLSWNGIDYDRFSFKREKTSRDIKDFPFVMQVSVFLVLWLRFLGIFVLGVCFYSVISLLKKVKGSRKSKLMSKLAAFYSYYGAILVELKRFFISF